MSSWRKTDRAPAVRSGRTQPVAVVSAQTQRTPALPVQTQRVAAVPDVYADAWPRLREAIAGSTPLPSLEHPWPRLIYGFAQPLLGLRVMLGNRSLLGDALAPVIVVALVCLVVGYREGVQDGVWAGVLRFFVTFAALAPVPSVLFARQYARIAARGRNMMGLGPRVPYFKQISQSFGESIAMVVILGIGVLPFTFVLGLVPLWGSVAAAMIGAMWTVHWMVIEAYDNGRTLAPDQDKAAWDHDEADASAETRPWFVRYTELPTLGRTLHKALGIPRAFGHAVARLARDWRPEIALFERYPWLSLGFGFGTIVLLSIPGLNLLFRPAVVIAAAHLRGQVERAESARSNLCIESLPPGADSHAERA
jgi:hypothetical protein